MPLDRVPGQSFDAFLGHTDRRGRSGVGGPGEALMRLRLAALIVVVRLIFLGPGR